MVSQGSAATSLRYGGIYNAHIIVNFMLSLTVKNFENRSIFHELIDMNRLSSFFGLTVYVCVNCELKKMS